MKKFLLYLFSAVAVLVAAFAYILYTEGAFDKAEPVTKKELKPFEMKCEAGKCGEAKCGTSK